MLNRFHLIPERHGRTDRRTDRLAISVSRVIVLTRDKKSRCAVSNTVYTNISICKLVGLYYCYRQPLEGLLYKYTNVMKGWQYRWFVLNPDVGRLEYYEV